MNQRPKNLGLVALTYCLLTAHAAAADPSPPPTAKSRPPVAANLQLPPDLGTRAGGDDWPCFLGPQGDSHSREQGLRTDWTADPPPIVWQLPIETGYAMPSISRGRLFNFSRVGKNARLQCLASETGRPLWNFEYPTTYEDLYGYDNGPRCSPVIDGPRVYIVGPEGMLHCLRAIDGQVLWKVDTAAKFHVVQNFFGVGSTPLIFGDLLIANIGGSPAADQAVPPGQLDHVHGDGTGVVAFDKFTGEVRYALSDELASYASPRLTTIGGRPWCFVLARGGLLGFDPANGQLDFEFPWRAEILESVNASTPVVVDDLVLISETYGPGSALLRVRPGGSKVVWSDADRRRDKRMQAHWNTPVYERGYLYGSSGRHTQNAELRCIELASGEVKWSEPGLSRSSLLLVDGHLVCLTEYGELLLLRATCEKFDVVGRLVLKDAAGDGEQDRLLKYPAWAAPILSHGLMYVRGQHRLVCLEAIPAKGR
ncbi:MAG TPA: PQQ-binding-like beta-propeller repeat protein [Pirellulales bacterium]|jgi:outer membrane protein assembly factor BamB|nr:PQQ-binding-like beta-propeller repeat protein [Pirellulales bacterium]